MIERIKKYLRRMTKAFNEMAANSPTVIGSCNAIAKQYLKIKQENPNKSEWDIYTKLIDWLPSSDANRQALLSTLEDCETKNLTLLIFLSYIFNANLRDCSDDLKHEVIETIQKELKKYNLK